MLCEGIPRWTSDNEEVPVSSLVLVRIHRLEYSVPLRVVFYNAFLAQSSSHRMTNHIKV